MLLLILQAQSLFRNSPERRKPTPKSQEISANSRSYESFRVPISRMSTVVNKDNRRIQRYALTLPARVEVQVDTKFSWNEVTRLEDVSAFGAAFNLKRPVKRGRLLVISVPMPRQLRCYDYLEPQYRIWGLVRRCMPLGDNPAAESYAVGVAFIGKNPPATYLENPAKLYDLSDHF